VSVRCGPHADLVLNIGVAYEIPVLLPVAHLFTMVYKVRQRVCACADPIRKRTSALPGADHNATHTNSPACRSCVDRSSRLPKAKYPPSGWKLRVHLCGERTTAPALCPRALEIQ
jgi:hypothetical protein